MIGPIAESGSRRWCIPWEPQTQEVYRRKVEPDVASGPTVGMSHRRWSSGAVLYCVLDSEPDDPADRLGVEQQDRSDDW